MSLRVTAYGSTYSLIFNKIDEDRRIVCNLDGAETLPFCYIEYPLKVDKSFDPAEYKIVLLGNSKLVENDIYQVYDKISERRIGWCFPIQALNSAEHSYADNEHFLRYAYVAALKLLGDLPENVFTITPNIEDTSSITFPHFFPECVAVLVVSLKSLESADDFKIFDWLPSLFVHGYVPLSMRDPSFLLWSGRKPQKVRMNIRPMSMFFRNLLFIRTLFSDLLAFESNPLLRFFYLYQIVELLLEQVFKKEQGILVNNLISSCNDTEKTKDILDKISQYSSEKRRLNLLMRSYIRCTPNQAELQTACKTFLSANDKEHAEDVSASLYKVRNILFHQYRDVSDEELIDDIVSELVPFLEHLLYEFNGEPIHTVE